ncbi:MAG: hypothetical protein ACMZ64_08420 [Oleiphilus sp.]
MPFINEYVSEQDVEQNKLDQLLNKYVETEFDKFPKDNYAHKWTKDIDKNIFLVEVKLIQEVGPSGRLEPTNRQIFVLSIEGEQVEFEVEECSDSSKKLYENPFIINWRILKQQPHCLPTHSHTQIIALFKEALTCFGYAGARKQIPNTIVNIKM